MDVYGHWIPWDIQGEYGLAGIEQIFGTARLAMIAAHMHYSRKWLRSPQGGRNLRSSPFYGERVDSRRGPSVRGRVASPSLIDC